MSAPTPTPRFQIGRWVDVMDGDRVLLRGKIVLVGEYDPTIETHRYKVRDERGNIKTWNGTSLAFTILTETPREYCARTDTGRAV